MNVVLEAQAWPGNADLIRCAMDMHVFPRHPRPDLFDATYGRGVWWEKIDETQLSSATKHDMKLDGVDFTNLPEADASMDAGFFDPDYVAPGGRDTSTIPDFNERYGLNDPYESPRSLQAHINEGLSECARVLRPQGILMVKCSTYISSGKPWLGEYHTIGHGLRCDLVVEDIFVHISGTGPQPDRPGSRQQHARSNSSRLIVFRKPGRRTRRT